MSARAASLFAALAVSLLTAAGCGSSGPGVDHGAPSTNYPAPHASMPQVVSGGTVMTAPQLITITFSNDNPSEVTSLDDFASKLMGSQYWRTTTSEYGVGAIVSTTAEHLSIAAPASVTDSQIPNDLSSWVGSALVPQPTVNTLYLIYYPATTTITGFGTSCQDYGAYHAWNQVGAVNVAYAVIPRCAGFGSISNVDVATLSASHEAVEAATDPTGYGFDGGNKDQGIWDLVSFGGELGDYCEYQPDAFYRSTSDMGDYLVQATWSNASAAGGHNPCVPEVSPYFMAAPVMPDVVSINDPQVGANLPTEGVKIPVGGSRTIELDLYSDGDTGGPFAVQAIDAAGAGGGSAELAFSLDRAQGVNGEKLYLTIKVLKAGVQVPGGSVFYIQTTKGNAQYLWPAWVSDS